MAEDPAATAEALAVAALPAEAAGAARCDARHENTVADAESLDACADRFHGADRFVAEDAAVGDGGHVALQDVEVCTADRDGINANDGVGVGLERWVGHVFPCLASGSVIDERTHFELLPIVVVENVRTEREPQ